MRTLHGVLATLAVPLVLELPTAGAQPSTPAIGGSNAQILYTPVAPCRIIDTRLIGGALTPGAPRQFRVTASDLSSQGGSAIGCDVPFGRATVAFINFVAVNPGGAGNLRAWAYRTPPDAAPNSSVLNYALVAGAGLNIANAIALPICDPSEPGQTCPQDFRVQADGSATHLVADVVGFFERLPTEELPGLAVPTGTVILWDQSNQCPAGYTRAGTFDGRWLRGAATAGGTGGADTHTHGLSHTHGMSHTHSATTSSASASQASNPQAAEPEVPRSIHTHNLGTSGPSSTDTGGASSTTSGSASNVPPYADVLLCRKDAPALGRPKRDGIGPLTLGDSSAQLLYTPVTPCRIIDTRAAGGSLAAGVPREFSVTDIDLSPQGGSATGCNVPFSRATAALVNFVAVNPTGPGNLRAWAYRTPQPQPPNSSVLNYAFIPGAGLNVANGIAIPICDPSEPGQTCPLDFRAQADGSGTHLVADVVGFFERFPAEEVPDLTIPVGAVVIWDQSASCPAGYARTAALDGRLLRAASTVGGTGGADTHAHDVPHTHGMGNHTHSGTTSGGFGTLVGGGGSQAAALGHSHDYTTGGPSTNLTDGASSSTSESASNLPPYVDVLFCRRVASVQPGPPAARPAPRRDPIAPLALGDSRAQLVYTPVPPCRIIDTRVAGGALAAGAPREFQVTGDNFTAQGGSATGCGVTFRRATAAIINFVSVAPAGAGNLRAWAYREPPPPPPNSSVLNYAFVAGAGLNIANAIALPICDPSESGQTCPTDFRVQADGSATHLVADVVGYFERFPTGEIPGLAIPSGTVVIWDPSSSCPTGFTRVGAFDGRFLRGATSPGGTGGADTHTHGFPHTHGMGSHTHSGTTAAGTESAPMAGGSASAATAVAHTHIFTTGGPSTNTTAGPSPAVTGAASSLPPYTDVLFCRKI